MSYRVLLVDDHPIVREGYAKMIAREPDLEACGATADPNEALQLARQLQPHLAVVDLSLQDGSGLELCKDFRYELPELKILVVSVHDELVYARRVLEAGAFGYVSKREPVGELIEAIRRVLEGNVYLSPRMRDRLIQEAVGQANLDPARLPIHTLSDRELEVFEQVGRGMATSQVAEKLGLSVKTVESYRENIKQKLGLENYAQLAREAILFVLRDV